MSRNVRNKRSGGRGRIAGLPQAVFVLFVIAVLAGSVTVAGITNAYPPLTQGLHDAIVGRTQSGLASTLIVTDTYGNLVFKNTSFSPFAAIQLPSGGLIYDTSTGASGQVEVDISANIVIQKGTPTNYTIKGSNSILVDGKNLTTSPIGIARTGAPPSSTPFPPAVRTGSQLFSDFGGTIPSVAQSHTLSFSTSGSVTVCFTEGNCVTKTWRNPNIASVGLSMNPTQGAFALNIQPTTDTTIIPTPTPTPNQCPIGYSWNGSACVPLTGGGSVIAGTLVRMADGALKPIEAITVGDFVVGFSGPSGNSAPSAVLSTHQVQTDVLYTFTTPAGTITSDAIQPVFVQDAQGRKTYASGAVLASELRVGDKVFDTATGSWVPITDIVVTHPPSPVTVYDLRLSPYVNYAANGILVNDVKTLSGFFFCSDLSC